jgi:two-component system cell cycle sensor histidine kinase/response regulator CckA
MFAQAKDSPQSLGRIMIVEDESIIADHIATRLVKNGYTVAGILASSKEALDRIPSLMPDLILMDIRINGDADGIETANRVRERFDIPVIYLTAHSDRQTIDRAKSTGAFGFLTKPIHHTSLATSIEMALSKHRSDREARQQRAWIETVLATMGDAVAVVDGDWKVQYLNRTAEKLTGCVNAEAKDCNISIVLPLLDFEAVFRADAVPERLPEGTQASTRSGHLISVEGEIAASLDRGKVVGRILTFRDATYRHQQERKKRQEEKMQAVGRLTAGIAHDFNNLLCVILGYADLLQGSSVPGSADADALAQIRQAAETAVGITRQLVQYGRPEPIELVEIPLNQLILDTEELWRRLAGASVRWEAKLDPAVRNIRGDPGQIKQVLMNLIVNARDAMPEGGALTVETGNHEGQVVSLTVRDTGTGMSAETAEHLFEPYFTSKGCDKGTGLGLAIVYRIVSDLGGSIGTTSELGKGSAFTIYLPQKTPVV